MVEKITWSKEAINSFFEVCNYLLDNWTKKEVEQFESRLNEKLAVIKTNPRLGSPTGKYPYIHKTLLHKKTLLLYRYKPVKKEIVLLNFWNTQQNPEKLKISRR